MALSPPLRKLLYMMNLCFQLIIQYSSLLFRPFNLPVGIRTSKTEEEESESPPALSVTNDDFIEDEILTRLPIKSLVRFQQVSKHWWSRIRNRFFSKTSGLIVLDRRRGYYFEHSYYVPLPNGFKNLALLPSASSSSPHESKLVFHDSSNGLLLYETLSRCFLVYNPTTKQLIRLPPAPTQFKFVCSYAAIDFDPHSSPPQFKVARLIMIVPTVVLQLFSSQTNIWREFTTSFDDFAYDRCSLHVEKFVFTEASVFVDINILLHFDRFVLRFDIQEESFQRIELPQTNRVSARATLGKCNGLICLAGDGDCFKIWKLETEEKGNRWIPIYEQSCILLEEQLHLRGVYFKVVGSFLPDSEGMLIVVKQNIIYSYDFNTNRLVQVHQGEGIGGVIPFSCCATHIQMPNLHSGPDLTRFD